MTTTAIEVANRALKLILVEAADSPLEADEYQDFYDALNSYMADLESRGIRLGYTPVTGPDDEVTVPSGAIRGIVANMALEVAPDYGGKVSPVLVSQAADGMRAIRRLGQKPIRASFPSTLPRGTGAEGYPFMYYSHYTDDAKGVLTLAGNTSVTPVSASATPYRVVGQWSTQGLAVLSSTVTGRVTNTTDEQRDLTIKLSLTATATSAVTATFILMRNGAEQVKTASASLSTTRADVAIDSPVILQPGEFLEVWVQNDTDTADITVADAVLRVE